MRTYIIKTELALMLVMINLNCNICVAGISLSKTISFKSSIIVLVVGNEKNKILINFS